ncbi:hypothetical protein NHJ13051_007321 [Beauveria bassiana]
MSFYSIAGTQLHWRNAAFVRAITTELSHQPTFGQGDFVDRLFKSPGWKFVVALFSSLMVYEIVLFIIRPPEPTFIFMSWAVLALPVIDVHASSALGVLHPIFGAGMHFEWNTTTALANTGPLPWLPNGTTLQGFEDWYDGKEHYSPAHDPLHISNLKDDLLPELRGVLKNISIRHVSLIKLESTRKDVFPFKKDGYIWKKLAETFRDERIPEHALERLGTLTPTANRMTGDYEDGFHHLNKTPRGGISFDNAFTTASYTRKSFTGTLCGVTSLVADFNVEFKNHIYQPCFPQIFNAFNKSTAINDTDHVTYPWKTYMMQSITDSYDEAHEQLPAMGYAQENIITKEYLQGEAPKFGYVDLPDINYYGMAEAAIEDYIRDAFANAKRDNERVLLTPITSTTHHPFEIPREESNAAVQSLQILPTILDLLLETRSLPDEAFQAATELLDLYEGQSLIGSIHTESRKTGQPNWQFTVMNSGKATLGVRSPRDPAWRLVVPLVEDMEWRFTNLEDSPNETEEIVDFGYTSFLGTIEEIHGKGAAVWAEEAAFLARWWVDEKRRRYRYTE